MATTALAEVKEAVATGAIAEIYADIRHALRVPMVNLIFRNMATVPGCLEWVWGTIGPLYATGQVLASAEALLAEHQNLSLDISAADVARWGADTAAVAATCAAYGRANPANLLGLKALQFIMTETAQARARRKPARGLPPKPLAMELTALPPMADPASLNDELKTTLTALTAQLHGSDGRVIPSFYRHFTAWPALLDGLRARLQPVIDSGALNEAAASLNRDAHGYARVLYLDCPVSRLEAPSDAAMATLSELIDLFPPNICKMTLIARALGAAIKV
jgi:hypothetical protein